MRFVREKAEDTDKRDLMAAVIFHGRTRGAPDVEPGVRGTLSTLYRAASALQIHDSKSRSDILWGLPGSNAVVIFIFQRGS